MATDAVSSFPEADLDKELNPAKNKGFEVDSVSSNIDAIKKQEEAAEKKTKREKHDALQTLKKTILVSAIIAAAAGAAIAIAKKLREK